ncbi:MAG: hypothetical protein IJ356_11500 [Erysipelotrichaceae bacterium]|nr:hypothetical protein [Erysipelotrichaceae bacterium]
MKKVFALILSMLMLVSTLVVMPVNAVAENEAEFTQISDSPTVNDWKDWFNESSTEHAGGVWTDKSVFNSADDFVSASDEQENAKAVSGLQVAENNFLVSLSTIASTKSIVGYSNLPTDTMLVLDMSTSMINNHSIDELTIAANKAMQELLVLNNHNRVGVVIYAGNTTGGFNQNAPGATVVLLPLDRYTSTRDVDGDGVNDYLNYRKVNGNSEWNNMFIVSGVKNSRGTTMSGEKTTSSGTFIQDGIYVALQQFLRNDIEAVIPEGQIQAGTERIPIMVIMTDGEPTLAVTDYDGNNGSLGANELKYTTHGYDDITFLSQLTASYAKQQIDLKYGTDSTLFYTLGLNVDESQALVMNPDPNYEGADEDLVERFNGYWNSLKASGSAYLVDARRTIRYDKDVISALETYRSYSDGYYKAENESGLLRAFDEIVKEIILQSMYYPTLVESGTVHGDGYLTFIDYVGYNMEVKGIKGILLGDTLYDGSKLAQLVVTGSAGSVENPTEMGDNLVWALTERLGLVRVQDTLIVRELLEEAYRSGQISYNASTGEFSNYVGWYGDAAGKYVGFWDGKEPYTNVPEGAVAANKSFLFLDAVGEGHRETDILYASVQVSEAIKDYTSGRGAEIKAGEQMIFAKLPASLIPLVEYKVELNSEDPTDVKNMKMEGAEAPSRLMIEVGLDDDIDLFDIENTAIHPEELTLEDGKYVFYTNQWNDWTGSASTSEPWLSNTYAMFEPSEENEHYYFNEKGLVYSDMNGTAATSINAGSTYYRRTIVYKKSGSTASYEYAYMPIHEDVLTHAKLENGKYYIDKGVIYRYFDNHTVPSGNETNTLEYSSYPYVHVTSDNYHVDEVLGNNGKLLVDAYEGIKITKNIDATLTLDETEYVFVLNTDAADGTYVLYREVNGVKEKSTLVIENGSAQVVLKANESVYVLGNSSMPLAGKSFTVSETETSEYFVSKIVGGTAQGNSTVLDVVDNQINETVFTNSKVVNGDVVIEKVVVSEHASHKTDLVFDFVVTLSGENLAASYPAELVTTTSDDVVRTAGTLTAGENNTYTFNGHAVGVSLGHNDYLHISGLADGVGVNAYEVSVYPGFTGVSSEPNGVVVAAGETKTIVTTNTYKASANEPVVYTLKGLKNINDTDFISDNVVFNFKLERLEGNNYVLVDTYSVTLVKNGEKSAVFSDELSFVYDQAGQYTYRVTEVSSDAYPGIVYDPVESFFTVVVSDPGNGKLVISDVVAGNDTVVDKNNAEIQVDFNNQFVVGGYAEALIEINKVIETEDGVTLPVSGFEFEIYETDSSYVVNGDPLATIVSDATGKALFNRVYTQNNADSALELTDHYYVIKEKAGADHPNGTMTYDTTEYHVYVKAGSAEQDGLVVPVIEAVITTGGSDASETVSGVSGLAEGDAPSAKVTINLSFTNKYTPDPVHLVIPISGVKNFSGWTLDEELMPEFMFGLYYQGNLIDSQSVKGHGSFVFNGDGSKKLFTKPGEYTFVVKEEMPVGANAENDYTLGGVKFDNREYVVDVQVVSDENGKLIASIKKITLNGADAVVKFENSYSVSETEAVIDGYKTLNSTLWTLNPNTFSFELYEANEEFVITNETALQRVNNGAVEGKDAGAFEFRLNYAASGDYYYVVKEVVPADLDSNSQKNGITFDTKEVQVHVSVADTGAGELSASVNVEGGRAEFVNSYDVQSCSVTIGGTKSVDGALLEGKYDGQTFTDLFEFELYKAEVVHGNWTGEGNLIEIVKIDTVNADGTGSFAFESAEDNQYALTYDRPGDYYYIIKERAVNDDPAIDYDERVYYVKVNVADNMDGTLVAHQSIFMTNQDKLVDGIIFDNVVSPIAVDVELSVGKLLEMWSEAMNDEAPEFTFNLYLADEMGNKQEVVLSETVTGSGNMIFKDRVDNPETEANEETSVLKFTHPGTFFFVLEEEIPENKGGIEYDETSYLIQVDVKLVEASQSEDGRDDLVETITYYQMSDSQNTEVEELDFVNTYNPVKTSVVFNATKVLNSDEDAGKTLADYDGKFTLGLYESDESGSLGELKVSDVNHLDQFELSVEYDAPGVYYYVLKEVEGNIPTITYDDRELRIRVTVSDNEGVLEALTEYYVDNEWTDRTMFDQQSIEISNDFRPVSVLVDITKVLNLESDAQHGLSGFEFTLTEEGDEPYVALSDTDGKAQFVLQFNEDHAGKTFKFVVKEVDQKEEGMIYDTTQHVVELSVQLNDEGNLIVTQPNGNVSVTKIELSFTNTYEGKKDVPETPVDPTPTPVVPNTGDDSAIGMYGFMMAAAAILAILLIVFKKRMKNSCNE